MGDVPCGGGGGLCRPYELAMALDSLHPHRTELLDFLRNLSHVENIELPRMATVTDVIDNRDLRVQYLANDLCAEELVKKLVRREKQREKQLAIRQVYEMVLAVSVDLFQRIVANSRGEHQQEQQEQSNAIIEALALQGYANSCLIRIQKRFMCVARMV
jgi:hypothetical protein